MPTTILRTVQRPPNRDSERIARRAPGRTTTALSGREREYLTPGEVDRLIKTARKRGRYGSRDALMILMTYRHGLRASEICQLRWAQVDFTTARLTVVRCKGSLPSTQPIVADELRELRKLQRGQETGTRFAFMNERGAPVSVSRVPALCWSASAPNADCRWFMLICCAIHAASRSPTGGCDARDPGLFGSRKHSGYGPLCPVAARSVRRNLGLILDNSCNFLSSALQPWRRSSGTSTSAVRPSQSSPTPLPSAVHQERAPTTGAANRPSGTVAAIPAMRPFAAKEDQLPDYRPNAPSVDLFTADEHLVLCDWFGVDHHRSERSVRDILDEWNIPEEIDGYQRTSAAVAQILLERIQDCLPQWMGPNGGARPLLERRSHRKVELCRATC
jgi:Phage integrase family